MADETVNEPTPGVLNDAPIDTPEAAEPSAKTSAEAEAPNVTQTLKDGAAKLAKEATDRARTFAEDGKVRAGGALDELTKMISDAADTVDEKVGPQYGQYARTAAETIGSFSEQLKAKQLEDLIEDARGFVQKSPAIAIGTAAAIGFVVARLVASGLTPDTVDQA